MPSLKILASSVVLAAAFAAPPGFAETLGGSPVLVLADHSISASKLIGMKVSADNGETLGTVVDVLVKDSTAEPRVILSTNEKLVAVPLSHVKLEGSKAMMPGATRMTMASMPAFRFDGLNGGGG